MPFFEIKCPESGRYIRVEYTVSTARIHAEDDLQRSVLTILSKDPKESLARVMGLASSAEKYDRFDAGLIEEACKHLGFKAVDYERNKKNKISQFRRDLKEPKLSKKGPFKRAFFIVLSVCAMQTLALLYNFIG